MPAFISSSCSLLRNHLRNGTVFEHISGEGNSSHKVKTKTQILPSGYKSLSDKALIDRYIQRREQQAIEMLYERYGHLVFGICCKYLSSPEVAGDAVRQIFTRLPNDLEQYLVEDFRTWLLRVTKNYCVTRLRQAGAPIPPSLTVIPVAYTASHNNYLTLAEEQAILDRLKSALLSLDRPQRECVELFYLEKLTISAIAQKTGYPLEEVKQYIRKGKHSLRNAIKEKYR